MKGKLIIFIATLASLCAWGVFAAAADDIPRMTVEELKDRLGEVDLVVVDVRTNGSWTAGDAKVQGAVREDPTAVREWMKKYPGDRTLVFYCA